MGQHEFERLQQRLAQAEQDVSQLQYLSMSSVFYTHAELNEPWGVSLPSIPDSTMFHLLLAGQAIVEVGDQRVALEGGDFILLPKGKGHALLDSQRSPAQDLLSLPLEPVSDHYERLKLSGDGAYSAALCGTVIFRSRISQAMLESMPDLVLLSTQSPYYNTVRQAIELIRAELLQEQYATSAVVARLADIVILQSIRAWVEQAVTEPQRFFDAHADPRLAQVMNLIHQHPEHSLSIECLANSAAMSRTAFINHFKKVVGMPPRQYVSEWRLNLARNLLQSRTDTIAQVAESVGYQSEAAFSRAFKDKFGYPPSQNRR
ncbi:HTH-type transcriptional regulator YesS [Marinomonas aquimarina]|uniref:HTH-type transcriptional regulator YesS n=1 Tax=Marinomonas aquimarina TaxID=295068 RepID=A0A1A8TNH3_9GAMM|nr:AraC family transcriptional regulator [Marinomonas aquimarina]SBS34769.1 HTH-type transcriptional regulator YesS [Marinomonas aquimarina]